ncbi:ABC transporter permease [Bordetella sp. H567]|uniref:ABC transporter permease n=1 Tax=Bordetella sp. H567 TaxID=1697043 RepID=UPI00081C753B|nr:ABC transporter permease [Bordetella sp. H567]AOB33103.1 ABC transporter permease [Bordetella sp. H567]
MQTGLLRIALSDIVAGIKRYSLVGILGWQDVRQRYRRSALGPFWLTISMGVMIGTIGLVFGQIFNSPMHEFLPFVAAGIILWSFVSSVVTEGCMGFITADGIIKQLPIPLFVHILRMIWRNIVILAHNVVILPLIFIVLAKPVSWVALLAIPGFVLACINGAWVALILAVLCARYRDLPQIVASVLQVVFYLTPIMWMPAHLPMRATLYLLDFNPCYHLLQVVRAPILGEMPTAFNWIASVAMALCGWLVALFVYGRYKRRIAYWL